MKQTTPLNAFIGPSGPTEPVLPPTQISDQFLLEKSSRRGTNERKLNIRAQSKFFSFVPILHYSKVLSRSRVQRRRLTDAISESNPAPAAPVAEGTFPTIAARPTSRGYSRNANPSTCARKVNDTFEKGVGLKYHTIAPARNDEGGLKPSDTPPQGQHTYLLGSSK